MKILRRVFNIAAASAGLLLLSPLLAMIAIAIKSGDRGPVFYRQLRVGRNFRPFRLLKFRSMVVDADKQGWLTGPNDARVTPIGRWLRRYKLDEFPQLWNVLMGDMQLVGARPEVEPYVGRFREEYKFLLSEPPGITDPASLAYRHEEDTLSTGETERQYLSQILPNKLRLSIQYQLRRTLASDVKVIAKTLFHLAA